VRALDAILKRRPQVVTIDRGFASSPRGAALINRIKADPGLAQSEIRVVAHNPDAPATPQTSKNGRALGAAAGPAVAAPPSLPKPTLPTLKPVGSLTLPRATPRPVPAAPIALAAPAVISEPVAIAPAPPAAIASTPAPAEQRGTGEAARRRISPPFDITVDGSPATLIDLSVTGAQVVSTSALKPNQRVRLVVADDQVTLKLGGSVAWASFEMTKNGPRYRAGVEFFQADAAAIESFCSRHASDE